MGFLGQSGSDRYECMHADYPGGRRESDLSAAETIEVLSRPIPGGWDDLMRGLGNARQEFESFKDEYDVLVARLGLVATEIEQG